jgi:hypothetical protein
MLRDLLNGLRARAAYALAIQDACACIMSVHPSEPLACGDWYRARDEILNAVSKLRPAK